MLAKLTDRRFSDDDWLFERKFDGERCLGLKEGDRVRLLSRNGEELNDSYPELAEAIESCRRERLVVDGEIVAFSGDVTSFSKLQRRMGIEDPDRARESDVAVYYYLFDVLHIDGYDTTDLPLRQRKRLLRDAIDFEDPLRFTAHRNAEGKAYYQEACRKGWEGIIAKRADSGYVHSRSANWLKFKCVNQQEFVIGGYTDPEGERIGFGALLVGYYADSDLKYAGKVGTGYDNETLKKLSGRLQSLERETPPFADEKLPRSRVHWVTPKLVAEVAFTEWTEDGKLRHPRFRGLRRDKEPEEVVREKTDTG
ncbi:MAG: ATP-dependent DNA ligase [Gemmatimonadetes bacterium]|uniref:DNA ligase (ATP) n=1 Tax=Candidatus Kutchimonas denitrificans TaxID=3056748 RepID=A0AAE4ZD60_9BACT|nr:ATP-dependent DNA ligase [Gemmatimonadota bacterium]NIR76706.1 ATP-dependent DNA ligase [Candidatus Kutchimonas denitrificans]NIS01193.1 ATP-dependent DNA ligase [Gemmatimonadota bacterium]NIT68232.1 ATP-dependent DNA ligase [Gemmatimonadota bacterium]NIW75450.1 ATP-dependent DNA ligase [Gemmatimonadota bacterium]